MSFKVSALTVYNNELIAEGGLTTLGIYNAVIPEVLAYHDNQFGSHGAYWRSNIVARSRS